LHIADKQTHRDLIFSIAALVVCLLMPTARSESYDIHRSFEPIPYEPGNPTGAKLREGVLNLSGIIPADPVQIISNYVHQYEGIGIEHSSEALAWAAAITGRNFRARLVSEPATNSGMISVTHPNPYSGWNAYLHVIQNRLLFQPATNHNYIFPQGHTGKISRVLVGSLGDWVMPDPFWMLFFSDSYPVAEHTGPFVDWEALKTNPTNTDYSVSANLDTQYKLRPNFMLSLNDGDCDADGVIDFADGYNLDQITGNEDDACICRNVTAWRIEVPEYLDIECVRLKFMYSYSDPLKVQLTNNPPKPAYGLMRLWFTDSTGTRRVVHGNYSATELGLNATNRKLNLEIEAIAPSEPWPAGWGDAPPNLEVALWGEGGPSCSNNLYWANPNSDFYSADNGTYIFPGSYEQADVTVVNVDIAMDGNRDGIIEFKNTNDSHYLFWVNDDVDVLWRNTGDDGNPLQEDDKQLGESGRTKPDCMDSVINCLRDLEDFTRLHIRIDEAITQMTGITYHVKFNNSSGTNTSINLFEAASEDTTYLSNPESAASQLLKFNLTPLGVGTNEVQIDSQYFKGNSNVSPFLVEGRGEGSGALTVIVKKNGSEISRGSVWLTLHPITNFYDIFKVDVASGSTFDVQVKNTANHTQIAQYLPSSDEYLLFVHGWNMPEWEKERWAETIFKRLWWLGYQGKVGLFSWPTLSGFSGLIDAMLDSKNYDNSEFRSWLSSDSLTGVFNQLNTKGQLRVLAHSMGNIVTGEALRKYQGKLHTYIASQAAISAHCYDNAVTIEGNRALDIPFWPIDPTLPINTPNIYGYFYSGAPGPTGGMPYVAGNQNKAGQMYNYYNYGDWALGHWELNNILKPDGFTPYLYGYTGNKDKYIEGIDRFTRGPIDNPYTIFNLNNEQHKYQIFAYCAESRTKALGQVAVGSGFTGLDLNNDLLGFGDDHYAHSRQFRSSIVSEFLYWETFLFDCKFDPSLKMRNKE